MITYEDMYNSMLNGPDEAWMVKERLTGQILHGHGASQEEIDADRKALEWELKYNLTKGSGFMQDFYRHKIKGDDDDKRNGAD